MFSTGDIVGSEDPEQTYSTVRLITSHISELPNNVSKVSRRAGTLRARVGVPARTRSERAGDRGGRLQDEGTL